MVKKSNAGKILIADDAPETYKAIIAADKQSVLDYSGHGNAIAQAYNHSILPLDSRRKRQRIHQAQILRIW